VILVKPMETVRFITQFTDFANDSVPYMAHCHMLVHEDDGMMLQFEVVDKTTGVDVNKKNQIRIYPNPLKLEFSTLNISGIENGSVNCEIYNLSGQLMVNQITLTKNNVVSIDLSRLRQGTYLMKIFNNKQEYAEKIVILN